MTCFRCGKGFEGDGFFGESPPPMGGLIFTARGNYGSTVFDLPPEGQCLQIIICDQCMTDEGRLGHVMQCSPVRVPPVEPKREPWNPDYNPYM